MVMITLSKHLTVTLLNVNSDFDTMSDQIDNLILEMRNDLDNKINKEYCIHVTSLINVYKGSPDPQALIRGKIYHLGLEALILQHYRKVFDEVILERTFVQDYNGKTLCYTPDVILKGQNKTVLVEIKSNLKTSKDYALIQTSIYKFLLSQRGINVNQCYILDGSLSYQWLPCNEETGKDHLDKVLKSSLESVIKVETNGM